MPHISTLDLQTEYGKFVLEPLVESWTELESICRSVVTCRHCNCGLDPWLVSADEIGDPADLELAMDVNGESRQRASTRDLILALLENAQPRGLGVVARKTEFF